MVFSKDGKLNDEQERESSSALKQFDVPKATQSKERYPITKIKDMKNSFTLRELIDVLNCAFDHILPEQC